MSTRPPTKARRQAAWDVGRSGDKPPEWVSGNADLLAAYDDGLAAHDDAVEKSMAPKPAAAAPVSEPAPEPAAAPATSPSSSPAPSPRPPSSSTTPGWLSRPVGRGDGTGLLLGLVAYSVFLNFIREGPDGVKKWASAKFLNKTEIKASSMGSW